MTEIERRPVRDLNPCCRRETPIRFYQAIPSNIKLLPHFRANKRQLDSVRYWRLVAVCTAIRYRDVTAISARNTAQSLSSTLSICPSSQSRSCSSKTRGRRSRPPRLCPRSLPHRVFWRFLIRSVKRGRGCSNFYISTGSMK
jgi:hypothetical protein